MLTSVTYTVTLRLHFMMQTYCNFLILTSSSDLKACRSIPLKPKPEINVSRSIIFSRVLVHAFHMQRGSAALC